MEVVSSSPDARERGLHIGDKINNAFFDSFLGLESDYIKYDTENKKLEVDTSSLALPSEPCRALVDRILILGTSYRRVQEALMTDYTTSSRQQIVGVFIESISEEIRAYSDRVMSLQDEIFSRKDEPITLIRIYGYSLECQSNIQLISDVVQKCSNKDWNEVLTCLYDYANVGYPKEQYSIQRVVVDVSLGLSGVNRGVFNVISTLTPTFARCSRCSSEL